MQLLCYLVIYIGLAACQLEILGISSYNLCFNVVPNAGKDPPPENPYLNCTDPDNPAQPVKITSLDLRLTASGTSSAQYNVDLTVVPTEDQKRQNTDGLKCGANPLGFENCVMTTPAHMEITSTKYVYYYNMRQVTSVVPQYCYAARFDAKTTDSNRLSLASKQHMNIAGTVTCMQNTHVEYCTSHDTTNCDEILDFFNDPVALSYNDFESSGLTRQPKEYKNANQNSGSKPSYPDQRGTCRDTFISYDSIRKGPEPAVLANDPNNLPLFNSITHDDYPTVHSFPISDPPPRPLKSKVNSVYGDVLQYTVCGGYNCGGVYSGVCYKDFYNDTSAAGDATAYNSINGAYHHGSANTGTVGMEVELFSLGPECLLYEIDEVPGVLVTVDFKVTIDVDSDGIPDDGNDNSTGVDDDVLGFDPVQTFRLTNLMGMGNVNSKQALAGARVVSVDTLDGYIGPVLPGYVIMCGQPDAPERDATRDYTDPRIRAQEIEDQGGSPEATFRSSFGDRFDPESTGLIAHAFIDMTSYVAEPGDPYDPARNPWGSIMKEFPQKKGYYPTGENLNYSPDNKRKRNAMWYYMNQTHDACLGRGCNQLGITDLFWNTNFNEGEPNRNTGIEQCYLSPFMCVPGYSNESFGGRCVPGCLASAAFKTFESHGSHEQELYNADQLKEVMDFALPPHYEADNPNYWPLILDGVGYALAFDPSSTGQPIPPLSFEVIVDFAGSFVSYESTVPNGQIVSVECSNGTEGADDNIGNITVENRGSIEGSYIVQIVCPNEEIQISPNQLVYSLILPGETDSQGFSFEEGIVPEDLPTDDPCVMQLLPGGGSAFAILDSKTFGCTFKLPDDEEPDPPVIDVDPSNPQQLSCQCFDFACYESLFGSKGESPCYWLVIIPCIALAIAFTVSTVYFYLTWKKAHQKSEKHSQEVNQQFATMLERKQDAAMQQASAGGVAK